MRKGPIHVDITTNVYPSNRASKHMTLKWTELKGKRDNFPVTTGDVNSLSQQRQEN